MPASGAKRRIIIGADHGGFELKEAIKAHLQAQGHAVEDCGTHDTKPVDYPVFAHAVARAVSNGTADCGIVVDRAGTGSGMAANKLSGVRAALCYDLTSARNSREHNNANVLTLGAGLVGPDLALQIVDVWLATECNVERHLRRAAMIEPSGRTADAGRPEFGQEQNMNALSDADIERIVRRVGELSQGDVLAAPAATSSSAQVCAYGHQQVETDTESVRRLVDVGADRVAHMSGTAGLPTELASYIDHTLLKPDATSEQVMTLCDEALRYGFASVCVNPTFVRLAADRLKGARVKVCSVVGFPLGAHVPEIKALEARRAIRDGAREIDMVINVGALKGGDDEVVYRDIRTVTETCLDGGAICKVIIEAALLTDDEKVRACKAAKRARAEFVKTSTGFGPGGATASDVALMAEVVREARMGVKAAGGIRTLDDAKKMIKAGATRLGASAGVRIVQESKGLTFSCADQPTSQSTVGSYG